MGVWVMLTGIAPAGVVSPTAIALTASLRRAAGPTALRDALHDESGIVLAGVDALLAAEPVSPGEAGRRVNY